MKPSNPFLTSGYHSPKYFCDREKETSTIIEALFNGRNITLASPRRMGKTGLIHHTFYHLKQQQKDIITLYMDIFSTRSLADFVKIFAETVLGKLDSRPQKALERIKKFIHSSRPVFYFDELTGTPKVTIDLSPKQEENTLKEIFGYLASRKKRCYIAIDEFQQILEYNASSVEALLRSYIQFLPNVNFIFSGSKQHLINEMFSSTKRPFYQSTQFLKLDAIDKNKYETFSINLFKENNIKLSKEVFQEIYNKFSGYTWFVQMILNRLYGYNKDIDIKLFNEATLDIISEYGFLYSNLLKAYTDGQYRLLKAIAKEGEVKEPLSGEFIRKYNLKAASSVNVALKKLVDNELVYQSSKGYIIYDCFLGEYLKTIPL